MIMLNRSLGLDIQVLMSLGIYNIVWPNLELIIQISLEPSLFVHRGLYLLIIL